MPSLEPPGEGSAVARETAAVARRAEAGDVCFAAAFNCQDSVGVANRRSADPFVGLLLHLAALQFGVTGAEVFPADSSLLAAKEGFSKKPFFGLRMNFSSEVVGGRPSTIISFSPLMPSSRTGTSTTPAKAALTLRASSTAAT